MNKLFISIASLFLVSSTAFASEAGGTISTGVSTGLEFSLPCNPVSVSNGTVNAQTCAITCTSGFTLSGNSCIVPPSSGGGGGGGGGGGSAATDNCPSGDTSGSFFDGKCSATTGTGSTGSGATGTGSATTTVTIVTASGTTTLEKTKNGVIVTTTTTSGVSTTTFTIPGLVIKSLSEIMFTDITNNWARAYITRLVARGIINNSEKYNPDNNLTRAEFLKIAFNAAGWKIGTGTTTVFADVADDVWYAPYVAIAVSKGIISDKDANFRPDDTISRAEAAKIIVGIFGAHTSNKPTSFDDVDASSDLAKYIESAKDLGIFSGQMIDGKLKFRPNDSITRAEIAKVIVNAFGL